MEHVPHSPYLRAIGARRSALHPELQTYFSAISPDHVGIGEGVFTEAGARRRLLRPFFRRLQPYGALYAGWAKDVPFTLRNTSVGTRTVSERTLHLPEGDWAMRDVVAPLPHGGVHEQLGEPVVLVAIFDADVKDGALELQSRRVGLQLGRVRVRIPRVLAPVIRLTERWDDATGRQSVDVRVDMALIGRVYEYRGTFTYRITEDPA